MVGYKTPSFTWVETQLGIFFSNLYTRIVSIIKDKSSNYLLDRNKLINENKHFSLSDIHSSNKIVLKKLWKNICFLQLTLITLILSNFTWNHLGMC